MESFPDKETRLFIPGPAGQLQAIATPGKVSEPEQASTSGNSVKQVAIVCHPHSLMGGTMNNKVVHTLARMHRDLGRAVIRFNFRGVEKSEGEYDAGVGETDDLLAVMAWAESCFPGAAFHIAGFSFGSFVAARSLAQAIDQGFNVKHLMLVAPAVENYDFGKLTRFAVPVAVIYGDADEVVDPRAIRRWIDAIHSPSQVACLEGAGHFFHGRLTELKDRAEQLLD
ncbi:MAG: alpha/beta hydrolase [Ketobacteraceae bacterium]|nr:alpha/beta hydrolase [Ketobacteraceae bacterium]